MSLLTFTTFFIANKPLSSVTLNTVDFRAAFEALPGIFIVLQPDAPGYTILAVSDEVITNTAKERKEMVGKSIFEVYPENPHAATATGPSNLRISLENALRDKKPDQTPVIRYDVPDKDGVFKERYWLSNNKPVLNAEGEVLYIILSATEVTDRVKAEKKQAALRNIEKRYNLFMQAPVAVCIVTGPENIVELANEEALRFLGRTADIVGKPLFESLPEAVSQGFPELLDHVRKTGETYSATEYQTTLMIDGKEEARYYNFIYKPYYENPADREPAGVFSVAHDVTEQVLARKRAEEVTERLNFRNALFEAQNQVTTDGVLIVDPVGKILLHNKAFIEMWKMPQEIIDSKDDNAALQYAATLLANPDDFINQITDLYAEHKKPSKEELFFKDGRVIERTGTPIVAENGSYYGWAWYFRNITERIIQEQKFRNVVEQAADPILILKGEDLVLEVANEALFKLWQVGPEALNKPFLEILPEMEGQVFAGLLKKVLKTGKPFYGYETPAVFIREDGNEETFYLNFSYQPYREADGRITGVLVFATDVTEHVATKRQLVESESRFRNIVQQSPVAFALTRGENVVVDSINGPMLRMMNKEKEEEVIGKAIIEVLPEIKDQPILGILKNVTATGQSFNGREVPVTLHIGGKLSEHYFNVSYTPLIEEGKVTGVLHVAIDVTEQVTAIRKVEASEQQLRSFIESAPFPIGIYTGPKMQIQFANQSLLDVWWKGNNVIGKTYAEVLPELEDQKIYDQLDEVFTTGVPFHAKNQRVDLLVNEKLQPFYFNYSFTPLFDAEGRVYGVMNTAAEVTDLNLAHKKIEESEKNLRNIILQAPVAMSILKGSSFIVEIANDRMYELWGRRSEELLNNPIFEALPEAKAQGFEQLLEKVFTTGETFSAYGVPVTLPRQDRIETVYINFVYEAFREGDGTISSVMVVATDVTEQVVVSKKIEEAEERARLAVDSAELGTYEVNLLTNEIISSPRMNAIFDIEDSSDRGRYITAFHPEDLEVRDEAYKKASETSIIDYEGRIICKDGSVGWVRVKGKMYYDEENKPVRLLGVVQDITDQKEFSEALRKKVEERTRELGEVNEHLGLMNKELEQFTYAASHDMQEPLRKVQTFSSILLQYHAEQLDEKGKSYLEKISTSVNRMKTIINDLLNYSHQTKEDQVFTSVDLNEIIEQSEADLELVIQQKQAVIVKDVLPQIVGAPSQINQLFFNLFSNALKFSQPGVPVRIKITSQLALPHEQAVRGIYSNLPYVKISFIDNGIGFNQQYAEKIFSLFKRLHGRNEYEGTGIGLGLCKKIVQNHHGAIWAESEPGKGAAFHILLPA